MDLLLSIYSFLGSTIAIVLAYLQIRDRNPRVVINAFLTGGGSLPPRDFSSDAVLSETPVIQVVIFNQGKITVYPRQIYLSFAAKVGRIETEANLYYAQNPYKAFKFGPLEPDRSFAFIAGRDLYETLPDSALTGKVVSMQVICVFENGRRYKSNRFTVDRSSLKGPLPKSEPQTNPFRNVSGL